MKLDNELFRLIVQNTPLISIDLVVSDGHSRYLLGKRKNKPAENSWFVPGGRIMKAESVEQAFERISSNELGQTFDLRDARFLGQFEHFYDDSVFGDDISTHYVVLAYECVLSDSDFKLPDEQHSAYQWFTQQELLADINVHSYTKAYFK
ncbi:GDP-mannose mannosyl hydrolase [Psychrobacter sp.]|uniref:GDP-mannose mannosyl hydrolase n=1 Tax=Psychrobacter sp. TaxID=56811 RepID=UPI003F98DF0F